MPDDYLLEAAIGALQGFTSAYLPFKQREQQDLLNQQAEKRQMDNQLSLYKAKFPLERQQEMDKFNRENFIPSDQLPENLQTELKIPTGSNIRKDALGPAVQLMKDKKDRNSQKQFIKKSDLMKAIDSGKQINANDYTVIDDTVDKNKLTTEGKKTVGNLDEGIVSIDNALSLSKKSPVSTRVGTMKLPLLGELPGRAAVALTPGLSSDDAASFSFEIDNAKDVLARYRTGAAINNNELQLYSKLLNDAVASDSVREKNLTRVRDFFSRVKNELETGKRNFSSGDKVNMSNDFGMQNSDSAESMTPEQREALDKLGL